MGEGMRGGEHLHARQVSHMREALRQPRRVPCRQWPSAVIRSHQGSSEFIKVGLVISSCICGTYML